MVTHRATYCELQIDVFLDDRNDSHLVDESVVSDLQPVAFPDFWGSVHDAWHDEQVVFLIALVGVEGGRLDPPTGHFQFFGVVEGEKPHSQVVVKVIQT